MDSPTQGISFILPPKEQGLVCPHLPPIPIPKQIQGSGLDIHFQPCVGTACAIYRNCQGDASPVASLDRNKRRDAMLVGVMRSLKGVPFLSAESKELIESVASKMEANAVEPTPAPVAGAAPATA